MYDSRGLFLLVTPAGRTHWRFRYSFAHREKLLSLGSYPEVSLAKARKLRDEIRSQLLNGIDPSAARQAEKLKYAAQGETFQSVAEEWLTEHAHNWTPAYAKRVARHLELDIYPRLGGSQIGQLAPRELLLALRKIQDRGALDTAHRVKQICGRVLRYAVATGRAERDCTVDLTGA